MDYFDKFTIQVYKKKEVGPFLQYHQVTYKTFNYFVSAILYGVNWTF